MKFPKEVNTYCPFCRKHMLHTAKNMSKGKARGMAKGTLRHERRLKGHGGKRRGEKTVKKQGKKQVVILTCSKCSKKHQKVIPKRTGVKIEIKR